MNMKVVIGIIMIAVLMVIFPLVMTATHDLQTDSYTEAEADVTTGVGETTADVVLTNSLWNDASDSVTAITSDDVDDTPVAGTYVAATNTLTVTGLAAETTRDLSIVYEHDALTTFTGMGPLVSITPLLLWISVLGVVIAGLYQGVKQFRGGG